MLIETFNISFESTQTKQQHDTKITCTRGKGGGEVIYGDEECDKAFGGVSWL